MEYLIKLIKFDCELERFAEVFGDILDSEDIKVFLDVAKKIAPMVDFKAVETAENPFEAFDSLDIAVTEEINKLDPRGKFTPRNYLLIRAFFRFYNDSYIWEDFEDLSRWETELFDSLDNYGQKNYKPIKAETDKDYREAIFNKFIASIFETEFRAECNGYTQIILRRIQE